MTQIKTKTVTCPNIIVLAIQWLLAFACIGALVQAIYLSVTDGVLNTEAFTLVFTAIITFALTLIPGIIIRFKVMPMPAMLHTVYVVFVYLAMFFGEMLHFYDLVAWWDTMLHFASGIIFSLVGYMVHMMMNKDPEVRSRLHPASIVIFTVIFAMACGVVWEIFEFGADCLFGANMQRWQNSIAAGEWVAMQNVTNWSNPGLMDTMKDFIMDTGGALLSIPIVLRMAKKNSRYTKTDISMEELTLETQVVECPKIPKPVSIPSPVRNAA